MKYFILFAISLFLIECGSAPTKGEKTSQVSEITPAKTEDPRQKYLSLNFATSKLSKDQTDKNAIGRAKALINEANVLLKLKKNEEAIVKFEEAFEFATDPEAYYIYGNALSNVLKLEESIKAYDIAVDLGYDKE